MCSEKSPDLLGPDGASVMLEAVALVAERSFFAVAEPCDHARFAELAEESARWLVASVDFREVDCAGTISCTVAEPLAHALFDAFSGRDQLDPVPDPAQVLDLVGEFANIVCGTWLTRMATEQVFTLSRPVVRPAPDPSQLTPPHLRMLLVINDLPLAVEVRVARSASPSLAAAGA